MIYREPVGAHLHVVTTNTKVSTDTDGGANTSSEGDAIALEDGVEGTETGTAANGGSLQVL